MDTNGSTSGLKFVNLIEKTGYDALSEDALLIPFSAEKGDGRETLISALDAHAGH